MQHFIERQMEDIEADVDAIERIGDAERLAVAEAKICIPLREQGDGEQQGYSGADDREGAFQQQRKKLDDASRCRNRAPTGSAEPQGWAARSEAASPFTA